MNLSFLHHSPLAKHSRHALLCLLSTAFCATTAFAAWQPGLQWGSVSGSSLNAKDFPAVTNVDLTTSFANTQTGWGTYTTYVYWGNIYLDGSSYRFGENIDDAVLLKVNGETILNNTDWSTPSYGTVTLPAGWYSFELRVYNGTGGAGPYVSNGFTATKGFACTSGLTEENANAISTGTDLSILSDPDDASIFRYDDGMGFDNTLEITGFPSRMGTVTPSYGTILNLEDGASFPCSVNASTITNAAGDVFSYAGYTLKKVDNATGEFVETLSSGNDSVSSFTFSYPGFRTCLTWQWNYVGTLINPFTSTPDRGSVTAPFLAELGESTTITATPAPGYSFFRWIGNLPPNSDPSSPSLSFTIDKSYSPEAVFSANYYVDPDAPNSSSPFTSWDTAAPTLKEAIDLAKSFVGSPATIYIANGTYPLTETIELPPNISLVGESRDGVIITGQLLPQTRAFTLNPDSSINSLTVMGCTNFVAGSGIYMNGGSLNNVRVTQMFQTGNGNPPDGVGVYMMDGLIKDCLIDANYMNSGYHGANGIGIYMRGGLVVDSTICSNTMNRVQHGGLGICMVGGIVRHCRIFANDCNSCDTGSNYGIEQGCTGHGVALNNANALLEDSFIYENGKMGVALLNGTVRNCVIYGHQNPYPHCAGLYMSNGRLLNSTIYGNVSTLDSSGLSGLYMTGGTTINNIIHSNGSPSVGSCCVTGGTFATNLTDVAVSGAIDSLVGNPFFVDPENHDFHLQGKMSLAVDFGLTLPEITSDLEGTPRPQGSRYDMGAFEYVSGSAPTVQMLSSLGDSIPENSLFTAWAELENIDSSSAFYQWVLSANDTPIFSFSGIGTDFSSFSHEINNIGFYVLSLTVTPSGSDPIPSANSISFEVKPSKVFVSHSGAKTYPFNTPETATDSVDDAFNAVFLGDAASEINIAEGSYSLSVSHSISTPLSVIGEGVDKVTITASPSLSHRAFTMMNANALLRGFTIEGCTNSTDNSGYCIRLENGTLNDLIIQYNTLKVGSNGTGGALTMTGGLATNLVVRYNFIQSGSHTTSGVGVYMSGGLLTDSSIYGNFLKKDECYGVGLYMSGGTARRLDIHDNTSGGGDTRDNCRGGGLYASSSAFIENCHIHHNFNGVYFTGGTLKNCLIDNNTWKYSSFAGLMQTSGNVINCTIADNLCLGNDANSDFVRSGGTTKNSIAVKATITGGTSANNLFNENPRFKSLKKYHLSKYSPAINAGDNSTASEGELDLDGNPRIHPTKNIIDLGCFESTTPSATLLLLK